MRSPLFVFGVVGVGVGCWVLMFGVDVSVGVGVVAPRVRAGVVVVVVVVVVVMVVVVVVVVVVVECAMWPLTPGVCSHWGNGRLQGTPHMAEACLSCDVPGARRGVLRVWWGHTSLVSHWNRGEQLFTSCGMHENCPLGDCLL